MTIKLQDLITAVEQAGDGADVPGIVAQALADNPDTDLAAIAAEAQAAFEGVDMDNPTDESIAALEALVSVSESVQQAADEAEAATAERVAHLASLSERMGAVGARDDEDPAEGADLEAEAEDDVEPPAAAPAEPVSKAAGADAKKKVSAAQGDAPAAGIDAPAEQDAAPIAASAGTPRRRVPMGSLPRKQEPTPTAAPGVSIVAAANVKGIVAGSELDGLDGLTAAVQAKIEALPTGYVPNAVIKENVATIRRPFPKELVASADRRDDTRVLDYAADLDRLGGNLVAAGGWCSPSETLYELPGILADAKAGLIDVPDIQVNRGGIRFNRGLDFKNIYAGVGFAQTEAQAIAGQEKTFWHIPCVDPWIDVRSDIVGFGLIAGVLQQDAYPEVGREATAGALAAHAHKVNASTIARMVAEATNVGTVTLGPSVTTAVLGGLEQQVVDVRYGYRAPETMQLEAILPLWIKPLIRQDLSLRTGIAFDQVDDGAIVGYFAKRGVRVQFVYDWQDSFTSATTPSTGFGGADAYKTWPDTVQALIYPAGTYVRGRGEVLSLDTIYDSTNLKINDYIQLFVEEKMLVARRAYSARLVTFPTLVNGVTSQPRQLDGDGAIVVAP